MPATTTFTDSGDLLQRVAARQPGAWAELVRCYTPLLRSRTRRYRLQDADAHDVMQTTWMRLAENIDRIHTPEHLGGWLATVVSRECQRVGRERGRVLLAEDAGVTDAAPEPGPEQRAVDGDVAGRVRDAVAALPPRRRDLVRALFADDRRPYTEIARALGVPIGSLGPTRARTLRELRGMLEPLGLTA
jgi:RNA polymerase sigma factor (sigma-70 family)